MKRLLLIIVMIVCACQTNAQAYKDSLYRAYVRSYMASREVEVQFTVCLYEAAEKTFTINNPAMRYAIKQSKMEDSLAIAKLGRETMRRFMDEKFFALACHHPSEEAVPIMEIYAMELCSQITAIMKAKGRAPDNVTGEQMDDATYKGTLAMTRDPKFIEKTAKLKEDIGVDKIKESLECNTQYLFAKCPYTRAYMENACVGRAVGIFMEYKRSEQMRMTEAVKYHILTGNTDTLSGFASKSVITGIEKSLKNVSTKVKELNTTSSDLLYRFKKTDDKLDVSYVCAGKDPIIVGGILLEVEWKNFKWSITDSDPIAAKDVKNMDVLVDMGKIGDVPPPVVELKQ